MDNSKTPKKKSSRLKKPRASTSTSESARSESSKRKREHLRSWPRTAQGLFDALSFLFRTRTWLEDAKGKPDNEAVELGKTDKNPSWIQRELSQIDKILAKFSSSRIPWRDLDWYHKLDDNALLIEAVIEVELILKHAKKEHPTREAFSAAFKNGSFDRILEGFITPTITLPENMNLKIKIEEVAKEIEGSLPTRNDLFLEKSPKTRLAALRKAFCDDNVLAMLFAGSPNDAWEDKDYGTGKDAGTGTVKAAREVVSKISGISTTSIQASKLSLGKHHDRGGK